jgi:hypothetical protein
VANFPVTAMMVEGAVTEEDISSTKDAIKRRIDWELMSEIVAV